MRFGKTSIFHTQIGSGLYQLSSTESGYSLAPGAACRNSYLVCGKERAILFDLALREKGLKAYAEKLAGVPVEVVLSHAHVDHIFNIEETDSLTMHPADEQLLRHGARFQKPVKRCPGLTFAEDGDIIDLGERVLRVIHIPGHTDGSILLYDETGKILLSGDTVARRLLYGMHGFVSFEDFCVSLSRLESLDISAIYSCHDRCALPPETIPHMTDMIRRREQLDFKKQRLPGAGQFITYSCGNEKDIDYFSMAVFTRK